MILLNSRFFLNQFNNLFFLFIYFSFRAMIFLSLFEKENLRNNLSHLVVKKDSTPFLFHSLSRFPKNDRGNRWNRAMFPQFSRSWKKGKTDYTGGSQWAIVMRIQNGLTWPGCSLLLTLHFSEKRGRLCKLSSRAATARRYDETIPCTPFNFWTTREG